jgi:hypothetical protein
MRKLHYEDRPPTLDELDASVTRARADMLSWLAQGETALAEVCEQAMNRFLEARAKLAGSVSGDGQ